MATEEIFKKVINNMRWRTPIAGLTTILFLFLYSAVIINIADFIPDHLFFQTVYFFSGRPYLDPGSCKVNRLG